MLLRLFAVAAFAALSPSQMTIPAAQVMNLAEMGSLDVLLLRDGSAVVTEGWQAVGTDVQTVGLYSVLKSIDPEQVGTFRTCWTDVLGVEHCVTTTYDATKPHEIKQARDHHVQAVRNLQDAFPPQPLR